VLMASCTFISVAGQSRNESNGTAIKAMGPCFGTRPLVASLPFDKRESYALYNTSAVPGDYSWQSVRRMSPGMRNGI